MITGHKYNPASLEHTITTRISACEVEYYCNRDALMCALRAEIVRRLADKVMENISLEVKEKLG